MTLDQQPGGFIRALSTLDEAGRAGAGVHATGRKLQTHLHEPLGDRRLLDKLPLNIVMLPLIKRVFPDARVILALRHPADVCLSCFFQEFDYRRAPAMANFLSLQDTVDFYGEGLRPVAALSSTSSRCKVHTVRYEDLVVDTEGVTRAPVRFSWQRLGSPRARLSPGGAVTRGTIDTPSYHQVSQPIYTRARYRWRHYESALAPWLDTLHDWAEKLGYARLAAEPADQSDYDH